MRSEYGALALAAGIVGLAGVLLLTRRGGAQACPAGQVAIQLLAQGPGAISAGPGVVTRASLTVCPHLGDAVQYSATADPGHEFLRFEGPGGVTTSQNPFTAPSQVPGFVRAVFQ